MEKYSPLQDIILFGTFLTEITLDKIDDKISRLKEMFSAEKDWESRYSMMIKLGKNMEPYPEVGKGDQYLIKGCQSKVWLYPEFDRQRGRIKFYADSESSLVKGIISILVLVYSDENPDEILKVSPDFLKELGITEHLSMNRNNGLVAMIKQIQLYAKALKLQNLSNS